MIAAVDATKTRHARRRCVQVAHARIPADVCLAGDGRRAALHASTTAPSSARSISRPARSCGRSRSARCRRDRRCSPTASCMSAPRTASSTSCARRRPASKCSTRICSARRRRRSRSSRRRSSPTAASTSRRWKRRTRSESASRARAPVHECTPVHPVHHGAPAVVQVFPYESIVSPGQTVTLKARLFDAKGNFIREEPAAQWSVDQLSGAVDAKGVYTAAAQGSSAGYVKATVGRPQRHGARARRRAAAVGV